MMSLFSRNIFKPTRSPDYKLSLDLYLDSDTIYLKGLDDDERAIASDSVLRGVLNVKVDHPYLLVESLKVMFVGKASDIHYCENSEGKTLLKPVTREIINDTYEYDAKTLHKGTYNFPFQFLIDPTLPESVEFLYGSRKYYVKVEIKYDNQDVQVLAHSDITIVRCPLTNSPKFTERIEAKGCWNDIFSYDISLESKIVLIEQDFKVDIDVYPLLKDINKSARLKYIKVFFIQKVKCPQMMEAMTEVDSLLDSRFFTIFHKTCIKQQETFTPNDDGYINTNWKLKIPNICPQFKVFPYNSNADDGNISNAEILDHNNDRAFRMSHYIQVALGFDLYHKDADQAVFKELTFKGKIHLVNSKIKSNFPPPAYDSNEFNFSPKVTREKSLTWLYTNGKLEMEQPPSYQNLVRLHTS